MSRAQVGSEWNMRQPTQVDHIQRPCFEDKDYSLIKVLMGHFWKKNAFGQQSQKENRATEKSIDVQRT